MVKDLNHSQDTNALRRSGGWDGASVAGRALLLAAAVPVVFVGSGAVPL